MKRPIFIRILAYIVHIIPIIAATIWQGGFILRSKVSIISSSSVLFIIIMALIFRNSIKPLFKNFGAFWISIIVFGLILFAKYMGAPLLWISGASLLGGIISMPIHIWYRSLVKPVTEDTFVTMMKQIIDKED